MAEYPGQDTIGLVTKTASGAVDSLNQPTGTVEKIVWVYGSLLDPIPRGPYEDQTDVLTAFERATAFFPYVVTTDGEGIPGKDEDGNDVLVTDLPNSALIRPKRATALGQRDYKMLGAPELQYDLDGIPDHVSISCEWRDG